MSLRSLLCLAILFGTVLRGADVARTFPVVAGASGADATATEWKSLAAALHAEIQKHTIR